ncbi:MAG: yhdB-like family protein [Bacillales bacterium]|jgi:hypothetical protein|nr:yhdB-like family protein [Bacillales bacterium]
METSLSTNTVDYDKALFYTYTSQWDELIKLMVHTHDDIFSKKIEQFVHAYKYGKNLREIDTKLHSLFLYIDHALEASDHQ